MANIQVHINRLVLDGISVPHYQRPILQAAVEAELTRLLTAKGLSSQLQWSIRVPQLTAGDVALTVNLEPVQMGQHIAQAVYGGMQL